ncbi:MAG TPA: kynureninase [Thermomicrobiales bacterium]|nr:kynureninase [Thermomicrobiales bacterium]
MMPSDRALDQLSEDHARALDAADPLARFRDRFFVPEGQIYLDGNSLGLLSVDAERAVLNALGSWKTQGIAGWLEGDPPWFMLGEDLGERMASLVGATPGSVVVTGTTTVNLHQMLGTFYRPEEQRRRVVATGLDFPSDVYAIQSQIRLHGGDPERDLVLVPSRDGRTIAEDDLIAAIDEHVALVMLPSVLYRSGQLLDIPRLAAAANAAGALIGLDCAHSVGALPHDLDGWDIDFAIWCTYKYLNAGPGAVGALYVNPRHFGTMPVLAGWWGYRKDRQFDMVHHWEGAAGAGAWQISTIPLLSAAAVLGSLAIFEEAGIDAIRAKSLAQTDYLIDLIEGSGLRDEPYCYRIGTPRDHARRGGHVAVEHDDGLRISIALKARGIVVDFRQPDVIRLAPVALYTTYEEIRRTVGNLREIIDTGAHLDVEVATGQVT